MQICIQFVYNLHTICLQFVYNLYTIRLQFVFNANCLFMVGAIAEPRCNQSDPYYWQACPAGDIKYSDKSQKRVWYTEWS